MKPLVEQLVEGDVHIWHAAPAFVQNATAKDADILASEERERAAAFVFEKNRELFFLGRTLLRTALSSYVDVPRGEWRFAISTLGKPRVDRPEKWRPLEFNLAHTRGLCVCAVAWQRAVGIDVEDVNRHMDWDAVARRFSPSEYRQIVNQPPERQKQTFFTLWTLKEAYAKARGGGLMIGLDEVQFELDENGGLRSTSVDSEWTFQTTSLHSNYRLGVAVPRSGEIVPRLVVRDAALLR